MTGAASRFGADSITTRCCIPNAGPASLRERVVSVGGSLAVESMTTGSRIEITLPAAIQHA